MNGQPPTGLPPVPKGRVCMRWVTHTSAAQARKSIDYMRMRMGANPEQHVPAFCECCGRWHVINLQTLPYRLRCIGLRFVQTAGEEARLCIATPSSEL